MNIHYIDTLPEVANTYHVELETGEKVVFTAKLVVFGTDKDRMLGTESTFTLTNRRIVADNGKGIWSFDLLEDVAGIRKYDNGKKFILRSVYYIVDLKQETESGIPGITMKGLHFYFDKKGLAAFDEIANGLGDTV